MFTQKLVLSYSTKLVLQFIQMATSLIVARLVGPTVIGILAYGLAFVNMFSFISDLGTGSAHIKILSSGNVKQDICVGTYARIKLVLMTLYILVVTGAFFYVKLFTEGGFESSSHEYVVIIYLLINIITQGLTIFSATWAARTEQAKQDIPDFIRSFLYQVFRLILAILGFKAIALALGNLFAVIIIVPLYFYLARDIKIGRIDSDLLRLYIKISVPVVFIGICQVLIFSTDKVYLQSQTSTEELGYYSAAFTLGSFIKTLEGSVGMLLFPYFSKQISNNDFDKINLTLLKIERLTLVFLIPGIFICSLFSDVIIQLTFGSKFLSTIPIFSVLILSYSISLLTLPYGNILFGMGFFKQSALIWGIALFNFIVLAYFIVSPGFLALKGVGMALVLLLTNITIMIATIFMLKKASKNIKILPGVSIMIFSIIFFLIVRFIIPLFGEHGLVSKIIQIIVVYASFYLIGYFSGIVKRTDFYLIKELLNINKLKSYISDEIMNKK